MADPHFLLTSAQELLQCNSGPRIIVVRILLSWVLGYAVAEASLKSQAAQVIAIAFRSADNVDAVAKLNTLPNREGKATGARVDATDLDSVTQLSASVGEIDHRDLVSMDLRGDMLDIIFPDVELSKVKGMRLAFSPGLRHE
ncbi:hypothetical protein AURDEDRAFT_156326 [Auricularia subglabra TFB-10046 SS5]|nr:hypothetical protein AURDEDRAFT_156326 [Auricularia subglabra TFB-10046 SS5]